MITHLKLERSNLGWETMHHQDHLPATDTQGTRTKLPRHEPWTFREPTRVLFLRSVCSTLNVTIVLTQSSFGIDLMCENWRHTQDDRIIKNETHRKPNICVIFVSGAAADARNIIQMQSPY